MFSKDQKYQLQLYRSFMVADENKTFLDRMNLKRLPSVLGDNTFVSTIKEKFFERKRHIFYNQIRGFLITQADGKWHFTIFSYARQPGADFRSLTAAASVVLLVLVLAMNGVSIWLRNRYERKW